MKKLNEITTDPEISKQAKEAGIEQDSLFYWKQWTDDLRTKPILADNEDFKCHNENWKNRRCEYNYSSDKTTDE